MTVFLVPNLEKEEATGTMRKILHILQKQNVHILMNDAIGAIFFAPEAEYLPEETCFKQCDVIITVGGDGTILHTARRGFGYHKPMLGVNLGRLGFLATVEADELEAKLTRLVKGAYTLDMRNILKVETGGGSSFCQTALNDVVIAKTDISQTIDIAVFCDTILVNHFQGDGVIIATPTGSTAYSLSAGGPILDAHIAGIVVTPICAHSMHSPPMVFSAERKLRVCVKSPHTNGALMSCDGMEDRPISVGDCVDVSLSDASIALICFNEADQFEAIDKKLKGR
ncbi:MAG: NAD(+)/NADH kinase [Ruthenibacterium sp.]